MIFTYVIEHVEGARWLTQYGWATEQKLAMRFRGDDEARAYLDQTLPGSRHNVVHAEIDEEGPLRAGAAITEYDPWGLQRGKADGVRN